MFREFLAASVVGVVLGSVMGMSPKIRAILQPTVTCFRQIPMIAWMPLIILWCGIGDKAKVVLIVIAAFFPVLVNTENGIETTPDSYLEAARHYKLTPVKMFTRVYLPHALPSILVGLKLGLSVSWMAVVGAELIASTSGIGYRMSNVRSLMQSGVLAANGVTFNSPKDIEGKRVIVVAGTALQYAWDSYVEANGIDTSKVL